MSDNTMSDSKVTEVATSYAHLVEQQKRAYWRVRIARGDNPLQRIRNLNKIGIKTRIKHIEIPSRTYQRICSRHARGLINYQKSDKQDLQNFCRNRGISFKEGDPKVLLISMLWKADFNQTFNKFMDLPPEMRVLVFEHYFDWLVEIQPPWMPLEHDHPPPPIMQTCKQLRKESFPVLADRIVIRLQALCMRDWWSASPPPVIKGGLFENIRNIKLGLLYVGDDGYVDAHCFITLSKDRTRAEVKMPEVKHLKGRADPVDMWQKTKEKLQEKIGDRMKEAGFFTLSVEDVGLLLPAWREVMRETGMAD